MKKLESFASLWVLAALAALLAGCNGSDSTATGASATSGSVASGSGVAGGSVSGGSVASSGSATLSWDAPTSNTNGSALTDLSGYRIYYGQSASDLNQTVQITSVGIQTYVIENLQPGTWYFAIQALTSEGTESALSDVVEKTIS